MWAINDGPISKPNISIGPVVGLKFRFSPTCTWTELEIGLFDPRPIYRRTPPRADSGLYLTNLCWPKSKSKSPLNDLMKKRPKNH